MNVLVTRKTNYKVLAHFSMHGILSVKLLIKPALLCRMHL